MKSRRPLNPGQPVALPSLPDTCVVRNLGSIWNRHEKSRGIRGSFLVFQAPEEACLELCRSPCFVRPGMLWTASLAIRSVASEILTPLFSMTCTSAFISSLCAVMRSCGVRARMMLFMPSILHCMAALSVVAPVLTPNQRARSSRCWASTRCARPVR